MKKVPYVLYCLIYKPKVKEHFIFTYLNTNFTLQLILLFKKDNKQKLH